MRLQLNIVWSIVEVSTEIGNDAKTFVQNVNSQELLGEGTWDLFILVLKFF